MFSKGLLCTPERTGKLSFFTDHGNMKYLNFHLYLSIPLSIGTKCGMLFFFPLYDLTMFSSLYIHTGLECLPPSIYTQAEKAFLSLYTHSLGMSPSLYIQKGWECLPPFIYTQAGNVFLPLYRDRLRMSSSLYRHTGWKSLPPSIYPGNTFLHLQTNRLGMPSSIYTALGCLTSSIDTGSYSRPEGFKMFHNIS